MWDSVFAQSSTEAASQTPPTAFTSMLPFLVAFIAIMYFLVFRPNQKREKERRDMLASLSKGDRVVTTGGMCGTVVGLNEKTVILRVSEEPNVKIEFARGAVSRVTSHEGEDSR